MVHRNPSGTLSITVSMPGVASKTFRLKIRRKKGMAGMPAKKKRSRKSVSPRTRHRLRIRARGRRVIKASKARGGVLSTGT